MSTDEILHRTFAEHEHLADDAEQLLAGLDHRAEARRRRHRLTAVTGVAAAVLTVAVGVSVAAGGGDGGRRAVGAQTSAPTSVSSVPSAAVTSATTQASAVLPRMTLGAGWLPGPATPDETVYRPDYQSQAWNVTVEGAPLDVIIWRLPGTTLPTRAKAGHQNDLTVNGHPAREWSKDGFAELAFLTGDGHVAWASADSADPAAANATRTKLVAIDRHIAREMRFDRSDPIAVSAVLTYLPAGTTVRGMETNGNGAGFTHYSLGTSGTAAQVRITGTAEGVGRPDGATGRPVQGHRTVVAYDSLYVLWSKAVTVVLSKGAGASTLAQLYAIADGIRFV